MEITVEITNGKKTYSEKLDMKKEKEEWNEWTTNGANPHLEKITFDYYHRPITCNFDSIEKYNGNHFIFGWHESFIQSDDVSGWMYDAKKLTITVTRNDG